MTLPDEGGNVIEMHDHVILFSLRLYPLWCPNIYSLK